LGAKKQDWQQNNQQLFHGKDPSGRTARTCHKGYANAKTDPRAIHLRPAKASTTI
jgi:hypothetical protein